MLYLVCMIEVTMMVIHKLFQVITVEAHAAHCRISSNILKITVELTLIYVYLTQTDVHNILHSRIYIYI